MGVPPGRGPHLLCSPASCLSASVLRAICRAPSRVRWPPMKPLACTKTQPGMAASCDSSSSRTPRHGSGRGRLQKNKKKNNNKKDNNGVKSHPSLVRGV